MTEALVLEYKCPFCGSQLGNDPRRTCPSCGMTERHRCVRRLYDGLRPLLLNLHCLNLTADKVVMGPNYFSKMTNSVYRGANHIDLQNIPFPENSFDFSVCNHVLEHIPDDKLALRELFRINSKAAQITIPVPTKFYAGEEYGAANPALYFHWRHYGADFGSRVKEVLPESHVLITAIVDAPTGTYDTSYLVVKDLDFAQRAFKQLSKERIPCIVVS